MGRFSIHCSAVSFLSFSSVSCYFIKKKIHCCLDVPALMPLQAYYYQLQRPPSFYALNTRRGARVIHYKFAHFYFDYLRRLRPCPVIGVLSLAYIDERHWTTVSWRQSPAYSRSITSRQAAFLSLTG